MKKQFLLLLSFVVAAMAADYAPPAEAISLEDPRMEKFCADPDYRVVLTGRLVGLPEELRGKVELSYTETSLTANSAVTSRSVELAADGSYRIEFTTPVPLRRVTVQLSENGEYKSRSYDVLLAKGLNLDFRYVVEKKRVAFDTSGPDKEMNDVVYKFENFEKEKQAALWRNMRPAARDTASLYDTLAAIDAAKAGLEAILQAYAPKNYGWVIQDEINVRYATAVLQAGVFSGSLLEKQPEWQRAISVCPRVLDRRAWFYYSSLALYLRQSLPSAERSPTREDRNALAQRRVKGADPEMAEIYETVKEDQESGRPTVVEGREDEVGPYQLLHDAGFNRVDAKLKVELAIRSNKGRIPDAKMDLVLLQQMSVAPEETRAALEPLEKFVGERWPRLVVARLKAECDRMDAVLKKAAEVPLAGFDRPAQTLPTGTKLYYEPKRTGKELLENIKTAHRGMTLMLGLWMPSMEGNIADMQRANLANRRVADFPVVFVYLGCRTDNPSWRAAIAAHGLSGIHVMITPKQERELWELLGGAEKKEYPYYVIIDKKGVLQPGVLKRFFLVKTAELREMLE